MKTLPQDTTWYEAWHEESNKGCDTKNVLRVYSTMSPEALYSLHGLNIQVHKLTVVALIGSPNLTVPIQL